MVNIQIRCERIQFYIFLPYTSYLIYCSIENFCRNHADSSSHLGQYFLSRAFGECVRCHHQSHVLNRVGRPKGNLKEAPEPGLPTGFKVTCMTAFGSALEKWQVWFFEDVHTWRFISKYDLKINSSSKTATSVSTQIG